MTDNNIPKTYDFRDNSTQYTVTIRNDLGLSNGMPPVEPDKFNFIHTWLVITKCDNAGNPIEETAISFHSAAPKASPDGGGIFGDAELEPGDALGDRRVTEEFIFNISESDYEKLTAVNEPDHQRAVEKFIFDSGWTKYSISPQDSYEKGVNCTFVTVNLLEHYLGINVFIDCLTPMDISTRFFVNAGMALMFLKAQNPGELKFDLP